MDNFSQRFKKLLITGLMYLVACSEKISPPENARIVEIASSGDIIGGYNVTMENQGVEYHEVQKFNWLDVALGVEFCRLGPSFIEGSFYYTHGWKWEAYEQDDGVICLVLEKDENEN